MKRCQIALTDADDVDSNDVILQWISCQLELEVETSKSNEEGEKELVIERGNVMRDAVVNAVRLG